MVNNGLLAAPFFITSQGGLMEHESVTIPIPLIRFVKFTAI
jgi:hypothetical protein